MALQSIVAMPYKCTLLCCLSMITLLCGSCLRKYVYVLTPAQVQERYKQATKPPTMRYISTDYGKLYTVSQGDTTKPLLVLIHGAPGRWYSSINLLDDTTLQAHYHIVTYDRLGFGNSAPYSVTNLDVQVNALHQLTQALNYTNQPVTIVGRSYGTPIAARYAMRYNNEVNKLFLLAPCLDPYKEKYFWFSFANKSSMVNSFMPKDINNTTDEKFTHAKQLKKIQQDWQRITVPTYIIQGRKDWIADTANAYFAQKKLVNAPTTLLLLDNTGHNVTKQHRTLMVQLLTQHNIVLK